MKTLIEEILMRFFDFILVIIFVAIFWTNSNAQTSVDNAAIVGEEALKANAMNSSLESIRKTLLNNCNEQPACQARLANDHDYAQRRIPTYNPRNAPNYADLKQDSYRRIYDTYSK